MNLHPTVSLNWSPVTVIHPGMAVVLEGLSFTGRDECTVRNLCDTMISASEGCNALDRLSYEDFVPFPEIFCPDVAVCASEMGQCRLMDRVTRDSFNGPRSS